MSINIKLPVAYTILEWHKGPQLDVTPTHCHRLVIVKSPSEMRVYRETQQLAEGSEFLTIKAICEQITFHEFSCPFSLNQ